MDALHLSDAFLNITVAHYDADGGGIQASNRALEDMKKTVKIDFSGDMYAAPRGWKHV